MLDILKQLNEEEDLILNLEAIEYIKLVIKLNISIDNDI